MPMNLIINKYWSQSLYKTPNLFNRLVGKGRDPRDKDALIFIQQLQKGIAVTPTFRSKGDRYVITCWSETGIYASSCFREGWRWQWREGLNVK